MGAIHVHPMGFEGAQAWNQGETLQSHRRLMVRHG